MKRELLFYRFAIVAILCFFSSLVHGQTRPSSDITLIQREIIRQERALENIHVKGRVQTDQQIQGKTDWKLVTQAEATCDILATPGSKFKIDFAKLETQWVGGQDPYTQERMIVAFNGRAGMMYYAGGGTPALPGKPHLGQISAQRPDLMNGVGGYVAGWRLSLQGFFDDQATSLSGLFIDPHVRLSTDDITINGNVCKVLNAKSGNLLMKWTLEPDRGFALVKYEEYFRGILQRTVDVDKLVEVLPNVYYPSHGICYLLRKGEPFMRTVYSGENISANLETPPHHFDIFFPFGTAVRDNLANKTFTAGENDAALLQDIDNQVRRVTTMESNEPSSTATHQYNSGEFPTVAPVSERDASDPHFMLKLLVITASVLFLIIVFGVMVRRRLIGCLALTLFGSLFGSQYCFARDFGSEIPIAAIDNEIYIDNSGLDACIFACRFFGLPVDVPAVAGQLSVGRSHERETGLPSLKSYLATRSLDVNSFQEMSPEKLVQTIAANSITLLEMSYGGSIRYLIVVAVNGDELLVANPGYEDYWLTTSDFRQRFTGLFTGNCLAVSQTVSGAVSLLMGDRSVEHEVTVEPGSDDIVLKLPLRNDSGREFALRRVRSSCGCFKSIDNPKFVLHTNEHGVLVLRFNRDRFGVGRVTKLVALDGMGDWNGTFVVRITANVIQPKPEEVPVWYPVTIDLGIISTVDLATQTQKVFLSIPRDVKIVKIQASSTNIAVEQSLGDVGAERVPQWGSDSSSISYLQVRFISTKVGTLREKITITTDAMHFKQIVIPILGRIK